MQIVPQYIDVEDHIAGPLTWKHIGWFFAGGGILLISWTLFDRITFFIAAAFIVPAIVALAFAKPNGVTLIEFLGYGINYFFRPRTYTWQRETEKRVVKKNKEDVKITTSSTEKQLTSDDVAVIAQTLDSRGVERNERLQQLLKEQAKNNKK